MTMTLDNQQQRHSLSGMGFDHYSGPPQFTNPWPTAAPSAQSFAPMGAYDGLPKPQTARGSMSMPYSSLPASMPAVTNATGYSMTPYSSELLGSSQDLLGGQRPSYDQTYSGTASIALPSYAPQTTYAPSQASSYAPISSYGQSLVAPQERQRRLSQTIAMPIQQPQVTYADTIDGARGILAMSQDLTTPRNIYGPRSERGSTDSYGFPAPHSSHSSVSSGPTYSQYFTNSADSSVSEYSSASESMDGLNSRTLPRPVGLMNASVPPAPQSMMGSFNSKISSSSQKKHKCKVCDKRFTRPSSLQTHMYSHTGEKPFACEVAGCGRNFSVVSNLRRHRKVHKGDRMSDCADDHTSPESAWDSHD